MKYSGTLCLVSFSKISYRTILVTGFKVATVSLSSVSHSQLDPFETSSLLTSHCMFTLVCCIYNKPHTLSDDSSSDCHSCASDDSHHEKNRYDRLPKHQRRAMRDKAAKEKAAKEQKDQGDGAGGPAAPKE